ncbi:MAG: tetratricopeptide repeat protein [Phycisphaera sp.]|nr:tetratricopeptide repeat protein [Phycisphaera sp.]
MNHARSLYPYLTMRLCAVIFTLVLMGVLTTGCVSRGGARASSNSKAQQFVEEGHLYLDQDLNDSALTAFNQALDTNPRMLEAYMGIGQAWRRKGEYDKARQAYASAVDIDPKSYDARYYLGVCYQLTGRVEEAVKTYLIALTLNPNDFEGNRSLAEAYLRLGRPSDALPYARKATVLSPDDQASWANLAATLSLLGEYKDAIDAYREALELGSPRTELVLGLADANIQLASYDLAISALQTLLRREKSPVAYERLGYAYFKKRQFEEALVNFRAALALDPNDTASLNGVGVCLMTQFIQSGQAGSNQAMKTEALDSWRKSVTLNPRQPRILDLISRYAQR